ncbi:MAG TPA: serine hydrolase, partial [Thermoanaerobaculia bacterium]|nr:serine hydrolase [Thermoanaerobaculia bacterium]
MAREVVAEFGEKGLSAEGLSITLVELAPGLPSGAYRGDASFYPASVVKSFYLAYYEALKEAGTLTDTPELTRAVNDMITASSNDATGFVVDSITGTTSGPEISGAAWESWKEKRNAINRFFAARGYQGLNANQKTYCEDAYGREHVFRDGGKNSNRMTTALVARLFTEMARGDVLGPSGAAEAWKLLSRDVTSDRPLEEEELEYARVAGRRLPSGTSLWAKSGDAYDVRHLVARVRLPDGVELVLAVFTKGVRNDLTVIPRVFEKICARY